jgi:hypothetical protein
MKLGMPVYQRVDLFGSAHLRTLRNDPQRPRDRWFGVLTPRFGLRRALPYEGSAPWGGKR